MCGAELSLGIVERNSTELKYVGFLGNFRLRLFQKWLQTKLKDNLKIWQTDKNRNKGYQTKRQFVILLSGSNKIDFNIKRIIA